MDLNPECKVFIGGLNKRTVVKTLQEHFEQWGELVDSVVIKDKDTKLSRGFGFVTYAKLENVDDCLRSGPHEIDERAVDVKRAVPKPAGQEGDSDFPRSSKVFMGGLPLTITEKEVEDMMIEFGSIEEVVIIKEKNSSTPRGFGFVIFKDLESARRAIKKKHIKYKERDIEVKPAQSVDEMKHTERRRGRSDHRDNYGRGDRYDESYYEDREPSPQRIDHQYGSRSHDYHSMGGSAESYMGGREPLYPSYQSEFDNRSYGGMKPLGGIDSRLGGYTNEHNRYDMSTGHMGGPASGLGDYSNSRTGGYGSGPKYYGTGSEVYGPNPGVYGPNPGVYGSGSGSGEYGSLLGGYGSAHPSGEYGSNTYGGSDPGRYGSRSGGFSGGMGSGVGPVRSHNVPSNRGIAEGRPGPYGGMGIHPSSGTTHRGYHPYKR